MTNKKNEWILTRECLPKAGGYYLVTLRGKYVENTLVRCSRFLNGKFDIDNVIAWMSLPLPYNF